MNVDLLMGEEDLKKTAAGNLFTMFGEPYLQIDSTGDEVVVISTASTCRSPCARGQRVGRSGPMPASLSTDLIDQPRGVPHPSRSAQ